MNDCCFIFAHELKHISYHINAIFFYSTLLKDIFKPACMLIEVESSLEQYQDNAFKIIQ